MRFVFFFIFFTFLFVQNNNAQLDGNLLWVLSDTDTFPNSMMSTVNDDKAMGVDSDASGNIYSAGVYNSSSLFVYKISEDGTILWKNNISSATPNINLSVGNNSVVVGSTGVFVVGQFPFTNSNVNLTISRTNSSTPIAINSLSYPVFFVVKYNFSGQYIRHEIIYQDGLNSYNNASSISDLVLDSLDNLYITGALGVPAIMDGYYLKQNYCNASPEANYYYARDLFTARYNSNLDLNWARTVDFTYDAISSSIAVDGDHVFVTGQARGRMLGYVSESFSSTPGTEAPAAFNTNSPYYSDGIVLKYNRNTGLRSWVKQIKSNNYFDEQSAYGIRASNGSIYLTLSHRDISCGAVCEPTDGSLLYKIAGVTHNLAALGFGDEELVLAKLVDDNSIDFTVDWLQRIAVLNNGNATQEFGKSLYFSPNGELNLIMNGNSNSSPWICQSTPITSAALTSFDTIVSPSNGNIDVGLFTFSTAGFRTSTRVFGGSSAEYASGLLFLGDALYLSGYFSGNSNFNWYPNYQYRRSASFNDAFVMKYDCPSNVLIPSIDTFCQGQVVDVRAQSGCPENNCGFNYEWRDPINGTVVYSSQNPYPVNTGTLGFNQLIVRATEVNSGCISRDTFDFQVNPSVSVSTTLSNVLICRGDSATVTASATPAVGASYRWYDNNDSLISSNQTASFISNGSYTVRADVNGCFSSTNINVDYFPLVSPRILPDTAAICSSSGAVLTVVDCPNCTYQWDPPPASSSNSTTNQIVADITGTYFVEITDQFGCTQDASKSVGTAPFLTPPIIAEDANGNNLEVICNGRPLVLTSTPFTACLTCTYQWSDGTNGPYTFVFNNGNYNVTVTDQLTGCSGASSFLQIRTSNLSVPTISASPFNICSPNAAEIIVQNPCPNCTYQWFQNANNPLLYSSGSSMSTVAADEYFVEVSDTNNCKERSAVAVIGSGVAPVPAISSTSTIICGSNTATLSTLNCSNCSFQWILNDTVTILGANSYQYTASSTGRYRVEVSYQNSCIARSSEITISSNSFNPVIGPNNPFLCNGNPIDLSMTGSFAVPPSWTYQWYYNGSPIGASNGFIHTATLAGNYFVRVTDNFGCSSNSNIINVQASNAGSNPFITASPSIYRCGGASVTLSASPCPTCEYTWRRATGSNLAVNAAPNYSFTVNSSQGYYLSVRDSVSNCVYETAVVEVKDTVLPTPVVSVASSTNICSTTPVVLSTQACASCSYVIRFNGAGGITWTDTVSQNTYSADTTGNYSIQVLQNGCASPFSSSVPVTRLGFNAQMSSPPIASICNQDTVNLIALPNLTACPNCEYEWFRDSVYIPLPLTQDSYDVIQGGNYMAVVKQTFPGFGTTPYTFGCRDTTPNVNFNDISVSVDLQSSALAVCGPAGQVRLSVDSCQGCAYNWFFDGDTLAGGLNYTLLSGSLDTFFVVNGSAAKGMYKVRVSKGGCEVYDSIYLPPVPAPVYQLDTSSTPYANICGGTPITLSVACNLNCSNPLNYQWYLNGSVIPGAVGASHLAVSGGNYQMIVVDGNGCVSPLSITNVVEVVSPAGFVLNLNPVGVIPLSFGDFNLDPYLSPSSLHSVNAFSSVPQPSAILSGEIFSPVNAGSGPHLVTYTYNLQNCSFRSTDTIQVLSQQSVDVVNLNPAAPPFEACISDQLNFILSNFTFAPDQILFPTSATTFDTVTVSTASLSQFAGVWSGNLNVIVPQGSVTGKVKFRRQSTGDFYQSPFFLVVQNPNVDISLNGVPQPLCSDFDTISLSGFPVGGIFAAAYNSSPATTIPSLISGSNLLVENVNGYDPISGSQSIILTYTYIPTYTNGVGTCPSVRDSLIVQLLNIELDSIEFTPISQTQVTVPMSNLCRLIWPLENRNYPGTYIGTYINANNLQAGSIPFLPLNAPPALVSDTVIYSFVNGICSNSIEKNIEIWKKPSILDSIPQWICQNADTIIFERNALGLRVRVGGINSTYSDLNYVYRNNSRTDTFNFSYDEFINKLSIVSSNGGLLPLNTLAGQERYALIPSQITGNSTNITLSFDYERFTSYFTPVSSNPVTNYTIATVSKTINIESPINAQVNPAILADPVFCQDNNTQQFSGIPNGGQYYLNNQILTSNLFNPNVQVLLHGTGAQTLKYVYNGNACRDSVSTPIFIPALFSVTIAAPNGPDYCQSDAPDTIRVNSSNPGIINQAAGLFLVNTSLSGQIFNPSTAPAVLGNNFVEYIARDTFGCSSRDTAIFTVNPIPSLRMDTFAAAYCLNEPAFTVDLYEDTIHGSNWHLQSHGLSNPLFPNITISLSGRGISGMPNAPIYNPQLAGAVNLLTQIADTIIYTYTNTQTGCTASLTKFTSIKPLPQLTLTTVGGQLLDSAYCERDTIPVFASPIGGNFLSLFSNNPVGTNFNLNNSPVRIEANIPGFTIPSTTEIIGYTYQDPLTFCRDTIRDTIIIRNFTTDPSIVGLPNQVCADDTVYVLSVNLNGGLPISNGSFGAFWPVDSSMIGTSSITSGTFNPFLSGIYDTGREVIVSYEYESNGCINTILDSSLLKPLPQLSFIMPGDTLFNSTDPTFHICFSAPIVSMFSFNRYNGVNSALQQFEGSYSTASGFGIAYDSTLSNWNYIPTAALPGLDTLFFTYTDSLTGCSNTADEIIVVDTVPPLGFAGFDPFKYDSISSRYIYCENDRPHLVIPSPFGGSTFWNYYPVPSILFELRPDTLVFGGQTTLHRLSYEFIAARYQGGGVCKDSTIQMIEIRPTPVITLASSVPNYFCVADSLERIVLRANPSGGAFQDISNGVVAGIVSDSLFNPIAQFGRRLIVYYYSDSVSGCSDTLSHIINVYNKPELKFESAGGCQGDAVNFAVVATGLDNSLPAIDSISRAIWTFGDGQSDTISSFTNNIIINNIAHSYNGQGIYFPSLIVTNQGVCADTVFRRIIISPKFVVRDTVPYTQDFQLNSGNWFQENIDSSMALTSDSLWEWGIAQGNRINTIQENNLVWITNSAGVYAQGENAWVYSPCFDISALRRPMIAMDIWRDSRVGVDGTVLQYFDVNSSSWKKLGIRNKGINWYNPPYIISSPGAQSGAPIGWSGSSNGWEDARYRLDVSGADLRGYQNLRFRLAFASSPNSVIDNLEGFAFDNFFLGNRSRSILVEHFSNQNFAGIGQTELNLYDLIYSNLYGRDVNLLQYQTEYNSFDPLHQQSIDESNSRVLFYGINNANQIRINGQSPISNTSDIFNGNQEILDIQMLQDAKFKIKLYPLSIQNGNMVITADVTALEDINYDDYALHIVVTEDSLMSFQNHKMLSVVRSMRPDPSGTSLPNTWSAGDMVQNSMSWNFAAVQGINYNSNNLRVVVFVQNRNSKEVYQVATSRNLNIFNGPVSVDEIAEEPRSELIQVNLYPNPSNSGFNVEFDQDLTENCDWKLVDLTGKILQNGRVEAGNRLFRIETENYSPGIYLFCIQNQKVFVQRKVVVKD